MNTPQLLTNFETCPRKGFYGRVWQPNRLRSAQMVKEAVSMALAAPGQQEWGELAGSHVLQLAQDRGLDGEFHGRIYDSALNHAALADILVSALRKPNDPPWGIPAPVQNWTPACLFSPEGDYLRRLVLVSHWTDERRESEARSWFTLGEIAAYELPMQLIVLVIGQQKDGLRSGPWSVAYLHPQHSEMRFRKRGRANSRTITETFNERWKRIRREDHAEISRETWLQSMLTDDVLPEVLFRVDIPIPSSRHLQRIREMAERKLERLYAMRHVPEGNLSTCDWPVPCAFKKCCHAIPEKEPSENLGFLEIVS